MILNGVMNYVDVFLLAEACAFPRRLPYSAPVPLIPPWVQRDVLSSLSESLPTNLAAATESPAAVPWQQNDGLIEWCEAGTLVKSRPVRFDESYLCFLFT